jgi:hypothetical protein
MTTEDDLFAECEALDEILALTFDLAGPEGLRALLAQVKLDQQELIEAADKLEQAGLTQSASIVREAAKQALVAKDYKSSRQRLTEIEAARRYWGGRKGLQCRHREAQPATLTSGSTIIAPA